MIRFLLSATLCCFIIFGLNGQEIRSFDGSNNNLANPDWGAVSHQLLRLTDIGYSDGISKMAGTTRPNPRRISNYLFDQKEPIYDRMRNSDFLWVFGQFIDHDISLSENNPFEPAMITVPEDDQIFPPNSNIFMLRSMGKPGTGTSEENPRQHFNSITSYIDASGVYGSDEIRASWLRTFENGKLKVSQGNLLPWNTTTGEFNDPKDPTAPFMADDTRSGTKLFVAGDIRANENPLLISMHTLFVREHNRMCDELKEKNPTWTDDQLYHQARRYISAYLQNIVYKEWLPAMGIRVPTYRGYKEGVNAGIFNVFSSAAFRMGHTLLNSNIVRMDNGGDEIDLGHIKLMDAFFNPVTVLLAGGIDPYFKGMATQVQQELDCKVIDDVRNFLFGAPGTGGLDLAAININRGRERGLPDYNTVRENFGLPKVKSFLDITKNQEEAQHMEALYEDVDNIDPWVGMLAEYHMPSALFGELIMIILERQFQVLRDGDRFYFQNETAFTADEMETISNTSLHDIIMRNTGITLMQENVFSAMSHSDIPNGPDLERKTLASLAYPNPTYGQFTVKAYMEEAMQVKFRIYGPDGRLLKDKSYNLVKGENFMELDLSNFLAKGIYNVLMEAGFSYQILKIVKE